MSDFLKKRFIKATRKDHYCYECSKIIPKGSECLYSSTSYDYEFHYGYFCYNCVPDQKPKELVAI